MKIKINSGWPIKTKAGRVFTFRVLPVINFTWFGGLDSIYVGWLFWSAVIYPHIDN